MNSVTMSLPSNVVLRACQYGRLGLPLARGHAGLVYPAARGASCCELPHVSRRRISGQVQLTGAGFLAQGSSDFHSLLAWLSFNHVTIEGLLEPFSMRRSVARMRSRPCASLSLL